jgi:valyl-tRNA synthetase
VIFDPAQLKVGRRLAIKILNASRFVLSLSGPGPLTAADARPADPAGASAVSEPLDAAMLGRLAQVIAQCTASFESYDHTGALAAVEQFFWFFCDDYLELVKGRAYGERGEGPAGSARAALRLALSAVLRLFAPFLPFVTEEVWSWWQEGSVHRAAWPEPAEALAAADGAGAGALEAASGALEAASGAIAAVRAAKSGAQVSMRAPVRELVVAARREQLDALQAVLPDVEAAGRVGRTELRLHDQPEPAYQVGL